MSDTLVGALIVAAVTLFVLLINVHLKRKAQERQDVASDLLNTPRLYVASVEYLNAFSPDGRGRSVRVTICNSGQYPTTVREGYIRLASAKYPEAYTAQPLAGIHISARTPYVWEVPVKHGFMHPDGVDKPGVTLLCQASYERPRKPDGEMNETYEYEASGRVFYKI